MMIWYVVITRGIGSSLTDTKELEINLLKQSEAVIKFVSISFKRVGILIIIDRVTQADSVLNTFGWYNLVHIENAE